MCVNDRSQADICGVGIAIASSATFMAGVIVIVGDHIASNLNPSSNTAE